MKRLERMTMAATTLSGDALRPRSHGYAFGLWGAALILSLILLWSAALFEGPLSQHMFTHIVLMGALAPLLALTVLKHRIFASIGALVAAALFQIALFFAWHSPSGMDMTMNSASAQLLMQASLLISAIWFWATTFAQSSRRPFPAVLSLVVTGKLFCLLAALWVFAPRTLFHASMMGAGGNSALNDQQLAGLLMLAFCPLTFLLAACAITVRCFFQSGRLDDDAHFSDQAFAAGSARR